MKTSAVTSQRLVALFLLGTLLFNYPLLAVFDRAALFLMDYPNQRRLKVLGRVRVTDADGDPVLAAALAQPGYSAKVERIMRIQVEAFDWNCPQHITPRFSEAELEPVLEPLRARIRQLEEQLAFASSV